jgi:hypothetical protein
MANTHSFAADYSEARDKFLAAARVAGATTWRYDNPSKGPRGEALSTDVARLGSDDASKVVVTISSTPRTGAFNTDLHQVGASYGVVKLVTDHPHWSADGH